MPTCLFIFSCARDVDFENSYMLSWIWLPLTQTAHHPWTTSPIMHCTHTFPSTITPITQLSPFTHQPWLPHHTCTSFTHSHKSSTQTLTHCEVLFCPGWHSERYSSCHLCVWPRTARTWNSEPVPVTSTPAWYCLRLCSASDIPVFACWPLPVCFCLCSINILLQVNPLASDQSLHMHFEWELWGFLLATKDSYFDGPAY